VVNSEDGSVHRFVSDPELYENLSASAESLNVLVQSLDPILKDVRIFSDKIAAHPELLGVSGAIRGSSGIKDPDEPAGRSILQSGGSIPR
jgi:phospholipid/cholesterol/gamma-HCH transport system substrate-binding protein